MTSTCCCCRHSAVLACCVAGADWEEGAGAGAASRTLSDAAAAGGESFEVGATAAGDTAAAEPDACSFRSKSRAALAAARRLRSSRGISAAGAGRPAAECSDVDDPAAAGEVGDETVPATAVDPPSVGVTSILRLAELAATLVSDFGSLDATVCSPLAASVARLLCKISRAIVFTAVAAGDFCTDCGAGFGSEGCSSERSEGAPFSSGRVNCCITVDARLGGATVRCRFGATDAAAAFSAFVPLPVYAVAAMAAGVVVAAVEAVAAGPSRDAPAAPITITRPVDDATIVEP